MENKRVGFSKLSCDTCLQSRTMKNAQSYFVLSGIFFLALLVVEFTSMYGNPGWFKVFALICSVSFLVTGIKLRRNSN